MVMLAFLGSTIAYGQSPAEMEQVKNPPAAIEIESKTGDMAADDSRPAADAEIVETETITTETRIEVITMPEAQPVAVRQLDFPSRGMTQDKVQNELGRPIEIRPAIGKPPITQWVYDDRIVYFEYSSVVHVVAR